MKNKYFHNLHYEITGSLYVDVIFVRFEKLIHRKAYNSSTMKGKGLYMDDILY